MSGYDEQYARIQAIFNLREAPEVTNKNLEQYLKWLRQKLTLSCRLTGIEIMEYFNWEERYELGSSNTVWRVNWRWRREQIY